MSKEAVCSNGLEMNDQHLVLGVYLVFHADCTAPGFDPHARRSGTADNSDWCTCALVISVILMFMCLGCDSYYEYHKGILYGCCPFSYRIRAVQEGGCA